MVGIFRRELDGFMPLVKGLNEIVAFDLSAIDKRFFMVYPTDAANSTTFNENSNINLLNVKTELIGAVGARRGTNANFIYITTGRKTLVETLDAFGIPFSVGEISLNEPMKISQYLIPKLRPEFYSNFEISLDTRNLQDLYLGQPFKLSIELTFEF